MEVGDSVLIWLLMLTNLARETASKLMSLWPVD